MNRPAYQGGHGYLERVHGLGIDNLLQAEVVTADGSILTASAKENPDLFWAIKGGGSNFGVVTRFRLQLHPIPASIFAGRRVHAPMGIGWFPNRAKLIEQFAKITAESKDNKATGILTLAVGGAVVEFLAYIDEENKGKSYFAVHRKRVGFPVKDNMRGMDYHKEIQKTVHSARGNYYVKGKMVEKMTPELAKALAKITAKEEKPGHGCKCQIRIIAIGGKASIQGHDCCAFRNGK
mmetsp:Transcript_11520/g.18970  ORF Transcript_11520/g.18970 Transcript_11520/m.18970 type:complete len:236 (+) Transcript_11520:727-1434(+)